MSISIRRAGDRVTCILVTANTEPEARAAVQNLLYDTTLDPGLAAFARRSLKVERDGDGKWAVVCA